MHQQLNTLDSLDGGGSALKLGFPARRALRSVEVQTEAVASSTGRRDTLATHQQGHQGLVTYVQTELGSSRPCQTPEGTSCGTEKEVGVGKERREARAGPGEKFGKHRNLRRVLPLHHRSSMAFIWCKDGPCSKELPPLPVESTTLDGSRSSDDHGIVFYRWERVR